MSARKEGSWAQFRAAMEQLHVGEENADADSKDGDDTDQFAFPIYQIVRLNLQRLGHAEFFGRVGESKWRVTPPTLAISAQQTGSRGVIAGARSKRLLARIGQSAGTARLEVIAMPEAPDALRLSADGEPALVKAAQAAGLLLQRDAPAAILQSLPTIGDSVVRRPSKFPVGSDWRIDRFDAGMLAWAGTTRREAERATSGLFRFSFGHQRMVFWCKKGQSWTVPGPVGKYIAIRKRRRHVMSHDGQANELRVPVQCRPPFLIERGLVACSGLLPGLDPKSGLLRYFDVPAAIARLAAGLLQQELQR
jgi:hypothetical protein